ncbi:MAG: hypothetical protein ABIN04_16180 [Ginsengibacter sp.]
MFSISEMEFYDFLKDRIKLSDGDARRYTKELFLSEEIREKREKEIHEERASHILEDSFDALMISMKKEYRQVTIFLIWAIFWLTVIFVLLVKY